MSFSQGKVYCFHKRPTYSKRFMSWAEISRDVEHGSQGRILGHVAQPYAMPLAPSLHYSHLPHHSPLSFPGKHPFSRGSRPSREPQWGGCVLMLLSRAPSPHAHVGRKSSETGVSQEIKSWANTTYRAWSWWLTGDRTTGLSPFFPSFAVCFSCWGRASAKEFLLFQLASG